MKPMLDRLSFLRRVTGGALLSLSPVAIGAELAEARPAAPPPVKPPPARTGFSDADRGAGADPAGYGTRGSRRIGFSDQDVCDPIGMGRDRRRRRLRPCRPAVRTR